MNALFEQREMDANAMRYEAEIENLAAARRGNSPFAVHRPRLYRDGNQWCALYGDDLQTGVVGFGPSPEAAEKAFNEAWREEVAYE